LLELFICRAHAGSERSVTVSGDAAHDRWFASEQEGISMHLSRERTDSDRRVRPNMGATLMSALAAEYPELASFTPDATLSEIKTRYGLANLDQVRELGRRRRVRRAAV
jgi:hypothetical protein